MERNGKIRIGLMVGGKADGAVTVVIAVHMEVKGLRQEGKQENDC